MRVVDVNAINSMGYFYEIRYSIINIQPFDKIALEYLTIFQHIKKLDDPKSK